MITEAERNTPLWLRLKGEWEARLEKLRAENDADLSEIASAKLRGRIAELKMNIESLGMGKPKPKIEVE